MGELKTIIFFIWVICFPFKCTLHESDCHISLGLKQKIICKYQMPTHLPQPTPGLTWIGLLVMEGLSWKFGRTQLDLTSK